MQRLTTPSRVCRSPWSRQTSPGSASIASDDEVPRREPYQTVTTQRANAVVNYDCIRLCPLFAGREELFIRRLKDELRVQVFKLGEYIMKEGEYGDMLYFMHRGSAQVLIGPAEYVVATLGDGSVFGELSLLGVTQRRTASIRAAEFCDCRVIQHRSFAKILQSFPKERASFQELADHRYRELEDKRRGSERRDLEKKREVEERARAEQARAHGFLVEEVLSKIPAGSGLKRRSWGDQQAVVLDPPSLRGSRRLTIAAAAAAAAAATSEREHASEEGAAHRPAPSERLLPLASPRSASPRLSPAPLHRASSPTEAPRTSLASVPRPKALPKLPPVGQQLRQQLLRMPPGEREHRAAEAHTRTCLASDDAPAS